MIKLGKNQKQREKLQTFLAYFRNHVKQKHYAQFGEKNIRSGKAMLILAVFEEKRAKVILSPRALGLT